jgi:Putative Actinobacterial Holin-X, holin superfamily III
VLNENTRDIPDIKTVVNTHVKTVADVVSDLKTELQEFLSTRVAMLRSELGAKLETVKTAMPMLIVGLLLLVTAWLAFTGFLVAIIAEALEPRPWAYVVSFLIVAFVYALVGSVAAMAAWKKMNATGVKPERTIRMLEQDRIWLQTEAKTQL